MSKENKLVPRLRFEEFKDSGEWENLSLGNLANIVRGASPRPIQNPKWFDKNSDVGWLRISDVSHQNGRIYNLEQKISKEGQQKTRVLKSPHLLISIAATVGKPVINYINTGVHDGFLIFKDPSFKIEFMYQWLEMFRTNWSKYGQPGSQVNLNSSIVKNQNINLPSLEEQSLISNFFQKLDELIQLQVSKINKVKAIKSAYLSEMFPKEGEKYPKRRFEGYTGKWEVVRIGDIFKVTRGNVLAVTKTSKIKSSETPYPVYSSQTKNDGLMGYYHDYLFDNAITWTTDGANAGTVKYRPKKFYSTNVNGVLLSEEGYVNQAVAEALNKEAWKHVSYIGNPKLMNNIMSDIKVSLPKDNKELNKISLLFNQLDRKIKLQKEKLEKLEKIKEAYLDDLFV